jgi:hypothetical protein
VKLAAAFAFAVVAACSQPAPPPEPIRNTSPDQAPLVDAPPADASSCVQECVNKNQMRAEPIENIVKMCAATCPLN